jgi:hypothetical protein
MDLLQPFIDFIVLIVIVGVGIIVSFVVYDIYSRYVSNTESVNKDNNLMQITRRSTLSGQTATRELPITQDQYDRWQAGELIQDVMPHLSPDDREFIITGNTPEDWEKMFGKEEE